MYTSMDWSSYHKKHIDMLERLQKRATKLIQKLRNISYKMHLKECGLTTLETSILRGDQIEVFKLLNGHENIDRNMFFSVKVFIYMVIIVVGRHCIDVAVVSYPPNSNS